MLTEADRRYLLSLTQPTIRRKAAFGFAVSGLFGIIGLSCIGVAISRAAHQGMSFFELLSFWVAPIDSDLDYPGSKLILLEYLTNGLLLIIIAGFGFGFTWAARRSNISKVSVAWAEGGSSISVPGIKYLRRGRRFIRKKLSRILYGLGAMMIVVAACKTVLLGTLCNMIGVTLFQPFVAWARGFHAGHSYPGGFITLMQLTSSIVFEVAAAIGAFALARRDHRQMSLWSRMGEELISKGVLTDDDLEVVPKKKT